MKKYTNEKLSIATRKCFDDIDRELAGEKKFNLVLKLLKRGKLSKTHDYTNDRIVVINYECSLKLDVDFLEKEGYLV